MTYVQDPNAFLRDYLDDKKARSGMTLKLRDEEDAADVAAFPAIFSEASEQLQTRSAIPKIRPMWRSM